MPKKKFVDDDEKQPGCFWKFVRGVMIAILVSAAAVAVLSIWVLPPPELPPEPEAPTGPEMIGGVEVSTEPAYTGTTAEPAVPEAGTGGAGTGAGVVAETAPVDLGVLEPIELSGPAFSVNAEPFEAEPETYLVAVILTDVASNPVLHELLFAQKLPLTIGVVAGGGGDRETAIAARAAGFEVVAELPVLDAGASGGTSLEYGMSEDDAANRTLILIQRLPMAVAVTRTRNAVKQPDLPMLTGMASVLAPLGFAFVDHGAAGAGQSNFATSGFEMPVGVSRINIPADIDAAQVIAILDRAAAEAAALGGAVVFAEANEQVILALQLWGDVGAGGLARLAPLSAVIRRQSGN